MESQVFLPKEKEISDLQEILCDLKIENVDEAISKIVEMGFTKEIKKIHFLVKEILLEATSQPYVCEHLVGILAFMKESAKEDQKNPLSDLSKIVKNEVKELLSESDFFGDHRRIKYFIKLCRDVEFFDFKDFENEDLSDVLDISFNFPEDSIERVIEKDDLETFSEMFKDELFAVNDITSNISFSILPCATTEFPTLLQIAAFFGSIKCFNFLVNREANRSNVSPYAVSTRNVEFLPVAKHCLPDLLSALHIAAMSRRYESVDYILNNCLSRTDLSINEVNKAFIFAAAQNDVRSVLSLYDYSPQPTFMFNNMTALHASVLRGNAEIAQFILSTKNADPNIRINGTTPFIESLLRGRTEIACSIIKTNTVNYKIAKDGKSPLYIAAELGNLDVVKEIIKDARADFNAGNRNGQSPLYAACERGFAEIADELASIEVVDLNKKDMNGQTPFYIAASNGRIEIIQNLLTFEDIEKDVLTNMRESVIYGAVLSGNLELVKLLVKVVPSMLNVATYSGNTPLSAAVDSCFSSIVEYLCSIPEIDVNIADEQKQTPLFIAARNGDIQSIKAIVNTGKAELNIVSNSLFTPLSVACYLNQSDIVEYLLSLDKIDTSVLDSKGRNILNVAIDMNSINVVKVLLARKILDINNKDKDGNTALITAAINGFNKIVCILLDDEATDVNAVNEAGESAFYHSAGTCPLDTFKKFFERKGVDTKESENIKLTPQYSAIKHSALDNLKFLVEEKGYNLSNQEYFKLAISKGNVEVVKYIKESGKCDLTGFTPDPTQLFNAIEAKNEELFIILASFDNVNLDYKNYFTKKTLFLTAVEKNFIEVIKFLETKEVDFSIPDRFGHSPFYVACELGCYEAAEYLYDFECYEINEMDSQGRTPLFIASRNNHKDIVRFLLSKGANINILNKRGQTPLYIACLQGNFGVVRLLLSNESIDVNLQSEDHMNPLYVATMNNYVDIVGLLLENETININMKGDDDLTPYEIAKINQFHEIIDMMNEKLGITHTCHHDHCECNCGKN